MLSIWLIIESLLRHRSIGSVAYHLSWRILHFSLAAFAFTTFLCILSYFPETSHPGSRGADKVLREGGVCPRWRPVILNPFSQLDMLRSPSILAVVGASRLLSAISIYSSTQSLGSFLTLQCDFGKLSFLFTWNQFNCLVLLVPLAYTIVSHEMLGICLTHSEVGKKIWDYKRDCNWCLLFAVWHRQCQYVDRPHVYEIVGKTHLDVLSWCTTVGMDFRYCYYPFPKEERILVPWGSAACYLVRRISSHCSDSICSNN